jgi:hypothetical protein
MDVDQSKHEQHSERDGINDIEHESASNYWLSCFIRIATQVSQAAAALDIDETGEWPFHACETSKG